MKKGIQILFTGSLVFVSLCASAQIGPPPPTSSGPIDSGTVALLVASAAYGFWMLKRKDKVALNS
jgi:hypothetical protein